MTRRQRGATIIEFALVLILFLMFMLGITDFARLLFTWNAANEATRAGARYASVCDNKAQAAEVRARMQALLPQIQTISVDWDPPSCSPADCVGVRVGITGMNYRWISPILGLTEVLEIPMPSFSTYVIRESMRQDPRSPDLC